LITWEWCGRHSKPGADKIISIFNYRKTSKFIKEFIEEYYCSTFYSHAEKLALAAMNKKNPYPAIYVEIKGVPYEGQIICGSNPSIYGRKVRNLQILDNNRNKKKITWEEIPWSTISKYCL
jgi:hypothetical protein